MERKRLLITGCGGHFMADTIDCFRKGDPSFAIMGVASRPDPFIIPLCDLYAKVPTSDTTGYIDLLLELCKKHQIDVLIPTIDDEIYPLYLRRDEFEAIGTKVSASEAGKYGSDKIAFVRKLEELCLPHPKYQVFDSVVTCMQAAEKLGYPENAVCVKLPNKAGSRGVRILSKDAIRYERFENEKPTSKMMDFSSFLLMMDDRPTLDPILMQEFLPGDEYSVDLLADNGEVEYIIGRRNVVIDNSIPMESVLEKNDEAFDICKKFVKECKLDGNIGFDFIFDKDGHPIPIELNARLTATISLSAWGGVNMAYWQVMRLLGEPIPFMPDVKYGRRIIRRLFPVFVDEEGKMGDWRE